VRFCKSAVLSLWIVMILCVPVHAEMIDRIIAVVNSEIITLYEFNIAFEPYLKNIENNYKGGDKEAMIKQTKDAFLQRMIDNILIEQEAKKTGISATVKDEEVMDVLQDTLNRQNMTMQEFLKNIAREGGSLEAVKKDIRTQMIRMRLLRREVKDRIIITEADIGEYYNKHRDEYEGKESVRIKQILLLYPPEADKKRKSNVRQEAELIRELLLKGESFDALVAKYSHGPAANGGDMGFVEKGRIIPEVEAAAFSLPVNEISDIIESSVGYHIIMVIDKKGAGLKPIEVVREEIKAKIEEEKLEKKYDEWISSVRAKSHIETKL